MGKLKGIFEAIAIVGLAVLLIMLVFGALAFFINTAFNSNVTTFQIVAFVWCFICAVVCTAYMRKND